MATFFSELLGGKGTSKDSQDTDSQGVSLKSPPMVAGRVLPAGYSSDYDMDLLDIYAHVKDGESEIQPVNKMFKAFESLIAFSFEDAFFRKGILKWPFL